MNYSEDTLEVFHNGKVTKADAIIITVPLGVLKTPAIEFYPVLPNFKKEAILNVGMNSVNKFLLVWDKCFWDDVTFICYTPEQMDKFNYFVNLKKIDTNANALVTLAYAEKAKETETMEDKDLIAEIMVHLRDMYG